MIGISLDELYVILKDQTISVEAAGAGFAASVALAEQFKGQETASIPALIVAGIEVPKDGQAIQIAYIPRRLRADPCSGLQCTGCAGRTKPRLEAALDLRAAVAHPQFQEIHLHDHG
jgi:hypothetical protein